MISVFVSVFILFEAIHNFQEDGKMFWVIDVVLHGKSMILLETGGNVPIENP